MKPLLGFWKRIWCVCALGAIGGTVLTPVVNAQTIYKCQLQNGTVEYSDAPCKGTISKVVHLSQAPEQLSAMSLNQLRQELTKLVQKARKLNADMYHEIRDGWARLGPHPTNDALTQQDHRVRAIWDPKIQETYKQMQALQREINERCPRGLTMSGSNFVCK